MKRDILGKVIEVVLSDISAALAFYGIFKLFNTNALVQKFWWISAIVVAAYALYENIDTIRSKEINTQGA